MTPPHTGRHRHPWRPYVVPALTAALAGGVLVHELVQEGGSPWSDVVGFTTIIGISVLGAVIRSHQPSNRVGVLLQVAAIFILLSAFGTTYGEGGAVVDPSIWEYLGLLGESMGIIGVAALFWVFFVFPDGDFLNRTWKWIGRASGLLLVLIVAVTVFSEELGDVYADEPYVSNPIGFVPWDVTRFFAGVAAPVMLGVAISGFVAVSLRFRGSTDVVRTQIKWVLYAGILMLIAFPIAVSDDQVGEVLWNVFFAALPVAMTIAITRYKLFEIDRLISRTISYAVVVAVLAGAFLGSVYLVTSFLDSQSNLAIAAATLAVAALFNPLRKRVQTVVDRKFNRSSYEARLVADDFAARLRQPHTAEEVAAMLNETVDDTLQPTLSGVWLRP